MKLIKPSEISARILSLIDESNQRLILVSPYVKISKWYKLSNKLKELNSRGVPIEIYVRDDPENTATYKDLDYLALRYSKIPHLHSKLYLNEKLGIVTSMNLLLSSEFNSREIGYETETWVEYNDLLGFFFKYIHEVHDDSMSVQPAPHLKLLVNSISENLNSAAKNSWTWFEKDILHISTGENHYSILVNAGTLEISFTLNTVSGPNNTNILNTTLVSKKIKELTAMKIELSPGLIPENRLVFGQAHQTLKSPSIKGLRKSELAYVVESICRFIKVTDDPLIRKVTDCSRL